jgi:tetratricopeptide (TPR) repeat protein
MSNKVKNIFGSTDCLSEQMLRDYAGKKLSPEKMHQVEKHLVDCELCSDALEGYLLMGDTEIFSEKLKEIYSFIDKKNDNKKIVQLRYWYAAAASILLIAGISVLFKFSKDKTTGVLSENTVKYDQIQKEYVKADSISAATPSEEKTVNTPDNNLSDQEKVQRSEQGASGETAGDFRSANDEDLTLAGNQQKYLNNLEQENQVKIISPATGVSTTTSSFDYKSDIAVSDKSEKLAEKESDEFMSVDGESSKYTLKEEVQTKVNSTIAVQGGTKDVQESKKSKMPLKNNEITTVSEVNGKTGKGLVSNIQTDSVALIPADELLSSALAKYNSGDYSGTVQVLDQSLKIYPNDYNTLYYCGMSYYYLKDYSSSIVCFDKLLKVKNGQWEEQALWFKALSLIEKSEFTKAKKILIEIAAKSGIYKEKALEKLGQLKK